MNNNTTNEKPKNEYASQEMYVQSVTDGEESIAQSLSSSLMGIEQETMKEKNSPDEQSLVDYPLLRYQ